MLNDRPPKPEAQWTWTRLRKDKRERSVLDYKVVDHGNSEVMEVRVCVEGRGNHRSFSDMDRKPTDGS